MASPKVTTASRRRYLREVEKGLAAFEKRELEFKARERRERLIRIVALQSAANNEAPSPPQP